MGSGELAAPGDGVCAELFRKVMKSPRPSRALAESGATSPRQGVARELVGSLTARDAQRTL